jgi:type I restriction enzyme R subunit
MRRVKSRILFEQMLGRATRLCPDIGKTHFRIFDAVGVYDALEPVSEMKPVVVNPTETFAQILDRLKTLDDEKQIQRTVNQIISRLRRNQPIEQISELIDMLKTLPAQDAKNFLLQHAYSLQEKISHGRTLVISEHEDFLTVHEIGFGEGKRPQDYLDEFGKFIATNRNEIAALNIVCTRPKDLTRADLKNLRLALSEKNFTVDQLNAAISQLTNVEITADIISLIRRYALGSELLNHEDKINRAVNRLKAVHDFSSTELKWLDRIEKFLRRESLINPAVFDETGSHFKDAGGFKRIDKVFGGKLANILDELNRYLYDDGGNIA